MKKFILTIVLATLCPFLEVEAQSQIPEIKPLNIGDTIPESVWHMPLQVVNHPEGKKTITLNDYRGKLIILDFWATYCSPCVASIRNLDTLQKQFNDRIKVLTVHLFDFENKALPFIQKNNWITPCILGKGDTLLNRLFFVKPRFGEVWIKDGKLFAIPLHKAVDATMISNVLNDVEVNIPMDDYLTIFEKRKPISSHK